MLSGKTHVAEMETIRRVYDNRDGSYIEIGPDSDGIGLVEIRVKLPDGGGTTYVTMTNPTAQLVAKALLEACKEIPDV